MTVKTPSRYPYHTDDAWGWAPRPAVAMTQMLGSFGKCSTSSLMATAVKPRPELEPFFRLNNEDLTRQHIEAFTSSRVELGLEHEY